MLQQHRTPTPLKTKLVDPVYHAHLHVLSIVGDGRCLFYSLLQSHRAMLLTSSEADRLRSILKQRPLTCHTDEQWERRVPAHMRDTMSRQQFVERYLTRCTAHVPHEVVALWQDEVSEAGSADVYILEQTIHGERVERIRSTAPAERHAAAVHVAWRGALRAAVLRELGVVVEMPVEQLDQRNGKLLLPRRRLA